MSKEELSQKADKCLERRNILKLTTTVTKMDWVLEGAGIKFISRI